MAHKQLPQIKTIPEKMRRRYGEGTLRVLIPWRWTRLSSAYPSINWLLCLKLAIICRKLHATNIGCTVTTGIFAWIVAHAAHEAELDGEVKFAPTECLTKAGGELNPKYPGGIENLIPRLEAEGHTVAQKAAAVFLVLLGRARIKVNEVFQS